jgi:hypothetical protein
MPISDFTHSSQILLMAVFETIGITQQREYKVRGSNHQLLGMAVSSENVQPPHQEVYSLLFLTESSAGQSPHCI